MPNAVKVAAAEPRRRTAAPAKSAAPRAITRKESVFDTFGVTMVKKYDEEAPAVPTEAEAEAQQVLTATTVAGVPSAPIDDQHQTMMSIFSARLLKVKAAKAEVRVLLPAPAPFPSSYPLPCLLFLSLGVRR
jgi:hypothetical protein